MLKFEDIEPIFADDGYRPNVGIVLCNRHGKVFWARRTTHDGWQFPQGGMKRDETPQQAMYRELWEETGLAREHVKVVGHTSSWLHYDLPARFLRPRSNRNRSNRLRGHRAAPRKVSFRGQKQLWFLLELVQDDSVVKLDRAGTPEFDQWMWVDYWQVLDEIVEFKRNVYKQALQELERYLPGLRQ
jgi:putative (di)nucleoside polyphosphate hydrolase